MKSIETFPAQYSTLSSRALQEKILIKYPLNSSVQCKYLYRGLNDNYLIKDLNLKYILRVYRHKWRNLEDIEAEIELLQYLKSNGVSVSFPIPDKEDILIQKINAPEGLRYAVLFSYAEGDSPITKMTLNQSYIAGKELAKIHSLTINKRLKNHRWQLDLKYLLDDSFIAIKPFIEDRKEDLRSLEQVIKKLKLKFESISINNLSFGICHGDLYPANYHISDNDEITIFDFDTFGYSWFAYDISIFYSVITRFYKDAEKINEAFLEGYQGIRKLSELEIDLIPYFGAGSQVWVIGTHCSNFEDVFNHFVKTNIKRNVIGNLKRFTEEYCK